MYSAFITLSLALAAVAGPMQRRADFTLQNGQDAIALNNKFKTLTPDSSCNTGDIACVDDKFAQCVQNRFVIQACAPTTICAALPLVNQAGTSITCTTPADLAARIAATGATDDSAATSSSASVTSTTSTAAITTTSTAAGGNTGDGSDPQQSLTLDPRVISKGFENDGQDVPTEGQIPSLTSTNNFINFCLTVPDLPLTNGRQIQSGSCNNAPIGIIPSIDNMPSAKFAYPKNGQSITSHQTFTIKMVISNLAAGNFVNAKENYFAAPQTLDKNGKIIGHTHHVIEALTALDQVEPTDPKNFVFFKGVDTGPNVDGFLTSDVTGGVPPGFYRLCSINSSANHQPVIVPIAQHGSLDDCVYFTAK